MAKAGKRLATEEGLHLIADAIKNTEAVQQAKAEIQAEGATQVANVQAAAEEITGKVAQIEQNTQGISELKGDITKSATRLFTIFKSNKNLIGTESNVLYPVNIDSGVKLIATLSEVGNLSENITIRLYDANETEVDSFIFATKSLFREFTTTSEIRFISLDDTPSIPIQIESALTSTAYEKYMLSRNDYENTIDAFNASIFGEKKFVDGYEINAYGYLLKNDSCAVSIMFPVPTNTAITIETNANSMRLCLFDEDGNYLDNYIINRVRTITIPNASVAFAMLSFVGEGVVYSSNEVFYDSKVTDGLENAVYGCANSIKGFNLGTDGSMSKYAGIEVSEKIYVVEGNTIIINCGVDAANICYAVEFDASYNVVDYYSISKGGTRAFTIDSGTEYIRFSYISGFSANVRDRTNGDYLWFAGKYGGSNSVAERAVKKMPPDYYFSNNYIQNKVDTIQSYLQNSAINGDAFFFITDEHWEYNAWNSPKLIRYIKEKTGISRLLDGGDRHDGYCHAVTADFLDAMQSQRVYSVVGNHEFLKYATKSMARAGGFQHLGDEVNWGKNGSFYYYVDNKIQKMRYIFLQAFDEGNTPGHDAASMGYNAEQLAWFESALNVDSGWTIVIVTHNIIIPDDSTKTWTWPTDETRLLFVNAINNYAGNGTIACVLQGHTHWDSHGEFDNGTPLIITTCDKWDLSYEEKLVADTRTPGTIDEQAFDVIIINKSTRTVNCVRIGAKINDATETGDREVREFTY